MHGTSNSQIEIITRPAARSWSAVGSAVGGLMVAAALFQRFMRNGSGSTLSLARVALFASAHHRPGLLVLSITLIALAGTAMATSGGGRLRMVRLGMAAAMVMLVCLVPMAIGATFADVGTGFAMATIGALAVFVSALAQGRGAPPRSKPVALTAALTGAAVLMVAGFMLLQQHAGAPSEKAAATAFTSAMHHNDRIGITASLSPTEVALAEAVSSYAGSTTSGLIGNLAELAIADTLQPASGHALPELATVQEHGRWYVSATGTAVNVLAANVTTRHAAKGTADVVAAITDGIANLIDDASGSTVTAIASDSAGPQ